MMDREMEERIPMPEIGSAVFECESVEEAREKAAELWGIKADDIEARIISEEKKLFGILGCTYKVEVRPFAPVTFIKSCHFVNEILEKMDLDLIPELDEDGTINLVGEDVGVVIGRYGETLKALEYLTNLACHDDMSTRRVRFDCGGYRQRRDQTLTRLAESIARESLRKGLGQPRTHAKLGTPDSPPPPRTVKKLRRNLSEKSPQKGVCLSVARLDRRLRQGKEKIFQR